MVKHWRVNFEPQKIEIIYGIGIYCTWNYWRVEHLAICSKNAVGKIFIW